MDAQFQVSRVVSVPLSATPDASHASAFTDLDGLMQGPSGAHQAVRQVLADAARLSRHAAEELQQARSLQHANHVLEHLTAVGQDITAGIDAKTVLRVLHRHVETLLDSHSVAIWLLEGDELVLRFGSDDGEPLPEFRLSMHESHTNVARSAREQVEILLQHQPGDGGHARIPGTRSMHTALFAPLLSGGVVYGVLSAQSRRLNAYDEQDRQVFRTLCGYGGVALANVASARRLAQAEAELAQEKMRNVLIHAGKLATIGQLASGLVHEMAHPVATIAMWNDTAQQFAADPSPLEVQRCLRKIERETDRLHGLIGRLRDFARSDPPTIVDTDLASVVADAKVLFMPRLHMEDVVYDEDVSALPIRADTERLGLVIANLVVNAMEALHQSAERRIELRGRLEGDRVLLSVRDTGAGIADDVLPRLFQPFFTTKPRGSGLGLGLSISTEAMTSMNGCIVADNHPQGGAVFTLSLPVRAVVSRPSDRPRADACDAQIGQ